VSTNSQLKSISWLLYASYHGDHWKLHFKVPLSYAAAVIGEVYTLKSRRVCLAWW